MSLACECDPDGTISGGLCVSHSDPDLGSVTGGSLCEENVEGAKCDRCKPNHYGLSAADPLGYHCKSAAAGRHLECILRLGAAPVSANIWSL